MRKDSITDYLGCILFKALGPAIRSLPPKVAFFLGRRLGDLFYYFDLKHKAIAYSNIKAAFGRQLSPCGLSGLTKRFYRNFGQNLIEIFLTPLVNKEYFNKYISFEGLGHIAEGFKKSKGVILLAVHEGSWELSNIISANLGFPFSLFIREQKYPRLNALLNSYRTQKGCKIIQKQNQLRDLLKVLKDNQAIGMTFDQGGKTGTLVEFLGKYASMASGAVRLALKYDAAIIPVFYTRIKGPYIKVIIETPFEIKRTGDRDADIRNNLQEIARIFEKYIRKYPQEYLWFYKIWKYANQRTILILSDARAGHLRQSEALAQIIKDHFKGKGITGDVVTVEAKFKNKFSRYALAFSSCLSGKFTCQGCLWCLKAFLKQDSYKALINVKADIVISCGSSISAINFILARENLAKSIAIMRPSILSAKRFDLVVMNEHDRPPKKKNICVIGGALNLINESYLKEESAKLIKREAIRHPLFSICISLLIGGDTKNFHLAKDVISEVIKQLKAASQNLKADILITTSRRTPQDIEELVKGEFKDYSPCKLLIIANENNIPEAVGGILALGKIIIVSPESISMISEAANSKKYVLVFNSCGIGRRHKIFLNYFVKNKYISLVEPCNLAKEIQEIWANRLLVHALRDNLLAAEAIKSIL